MPHFVEELAAGAEAAIVAMRAAALAARAAHARAELMRHMLTTARKVKDRPADEAVESVTGEWLAAWNLERSARPEIAAEMEAFTRAFHAYADEPSGAHDAGLRKACAGLEAAFIRQGTTLEDEMAFRSRCAHGWWEAVVPAPADLSGAGARPDVPKPEPGRPFWEAGCAGFCR